MLKTLILSSGLLISPYMAFSTDANFGQVKSYEITLTNEDSFHPIQNYIDESSQELYGIVADDESMYNDGSERYESMYNANNGKFIFSLDKNYTSVSINTDIKVSGVYDQYYSYIGIAVPVGADTLVSSQEIFHLEGTAKPNDATPVLIAKDQEVTFILDTWFDDNYGTTTVDWYMQLNEYGNSLTIWCEGEETGDIWATGSPIWAISEFTTAMETDEEYRNKEGNGAPYMHHYNFQTPESYSNNALKLTVTE